MTVWGKDELIRFWSQKVKGQGNDETREGQKSPCEHDVLKTVRVIFCHLFDIFRHFVLENDVEIENTRWHLPTTFIHSMTNRSGMGPLH